MFKEGTLISTNRGVIPIEKIAFARKEGEKSECISNIMLKTYDGEWNKCLFQTYQKCKGVKIQLSSYFYIECSENQKILTTEGIKEAKNIRVNDCICMYTDTYIDKESFFIETEKINYIPLSGNDIYIPKKMNEELAIVCGILLSPSTEIRINDNDKMVVVCKDRVVNKIFIRSVRDLFQTKQKVVVQDDKYCRIFSPYVIDFLNNICGLNHRTQKIHQSLMQANRNIQISFLNGLIMAEEDNITGSRNFSYLYKIVSKSVSDQIEAMLCLYGYSPFIKQIKGKKTICIRKPVSDFFNDKLLDKMKKNKIQKTIDVINVSKSKYCDYFGIICEKDNYVIKNLVFGE